MRNWPLILTAVIAFCAFAFGMNNMMSPEMYREMSPPRLGYVFVPDDDTFTGTDHYLEIQFVQFGPDSEAPVSVTAWLMRHADDTPEPLEFEPINYQGLDTDKWIALLPPLENKGDRWFYYITIETSEGRTIELRKRMNWFERLFSGFSKDEQLFWVTYEGNVSREVPFGRLMLLSHITLSSGALLFMFHTFYYSMSILARPRQDYFIRAYRTLFWTWLTFLVGAIFLGIPITWYTFGVGFMPWPTQGIASLGDVTDTKSTQLVLWWGLLLLAYFSTYRAALATEIDAAKLRRFVYWVFAAILLTVFVFLIPHSQFMQSGQQ